MTLVIINSDYIINVSVLTLNTIGATEKRKITIYITDTSAALLTSFDGTGSIKCTQHIKCIHLVRVFLDIMKPWGVFNLSDQCMLFQSVKFLYILN